MTNPRQANDQIPLGELLRRTREDRGMSRAEVARRAGITVNTLSKYERVGEEEDGYYPSSQKLASLCVALHLNPLKAILSCLSRDEYWNWKGKIAEDFLMGHPDHEYLVRQYFALCETNRALSEIINILLMPKHDRTKEQQEYLEWYQKEARRRLNIEAEFIRRTEAILGVPSIQPEMVAFPGRSERLPEEAPDLDYAAHKNGPGK